MTQINTKNISIYFGNQKDSLRQKDVYDFKKFSMLEKKLHAHNLFFLKQTHSVEVFLLKNTVPDSFKIEGDAIITQAKNIGIGVITADCLPIILHDPINQAIGIIHAGWQGLATKVITATIQKMHAAFGTKALQLHAYFGPSAGVCCYEVQADFLTHFPTSVFEKNIIEIRNGQYYFNERLSGLIELLDNHVLADNINTENNTCTICTEGFCSARKQKENAGRQPSIALIRNYISN
ncbi:MAG: hypothetical protein A3E82_04600 [Gammaproteobacteria bacterium RIFCSPHIGHO2_12_FULL_38_11]|nr:MAG: hypothetical protein A3E82_04600 [Gammaproteobacteria bacterium RIFCSPHIGHO2_12_FULL_38_11]